MYLERQTLQQWLSGGLSRIVIDGDFDMTLVVGGGTSPVSDKDRVVLDALTATTGWTAENGSGVPGWSAAAGAQFSTEAHQGPSGGTWLFGFSGFDSAIAGPANGFRMTKTFSTRDVSLIHDIGFYVAYDTTWQTNSNPARVYTIKLYMGSDGDQSFNNSVVASYDDISAASFANTFIRYVEFRREEFTVEAGTFDWGDMQDIRIEIICSAGVAGAAAGVTACRTYFNQLQINNYVTPTVIIGHDDGPAGVYDTAKAVLDSHGFKSTQYVFSDGIDTGSPQMTLAQLTELYNEGHDVALHATSSGDVLNTLTDANITTEIQTMHTWMDTNGFTRAKHCVSWPEGTTTSGDGTLVFDLFATEGVTCGRDSRVRQNDMDWTSDDRLDSGLVNGNMRLSLRNITAAIKGEDVLPPALDELVKRGGVLLLNYHNVLVSGAAGNSVNLADYQTDMNILQSYVNKGLIQIKTISEVYGTDGKYLI